jgi:hypothetical protein
VDVSFAAIKTVNVSIAGI